MTIIVIIIVTYVHSIHIIYILFLNLAIYSLKKKYSTFLLQMRRSNKQVRALVLYFSIFLF